MWLESIVWSSRRRASTADAIAARCSSSSPSAIASSSERSAGDGVRGGTVRRLRGRLAIEREDRHGPGRTGSVTNAGAAGRRVESGLDGDQLSRQRDTPAGRALEGGAAGG